MKMLVTGETYEPLARFVRTHGLVLTHHIWGSGRSIVRISNYHIAGRTSTCGEGDTLDESMADYAKKINGKTLLGGKSGISRIEVGDLI